MEKVEQEENGENGENTAELEAQMAEMNMDEELPPDGEQLNVQRLMDLMDKNNAGFEQQQTDI